MNSGNWTCRPGGWLNMLQAATWQHRLPNARIVAVALVMAVSGCASTGPNAPKTNQETAAGAVVGALGAAGGAVGGTAVGAVAGVAYCGPAFIICSPVFAVVGGVMGAVGGGGAGARAGVNLSRSASEPQISSPATHEKVEMQTALADPTRTAARAVSAGDTWTRLPSGVEVKTRTLTGEELVNYFNSLRNVEVKAPRELMSLTFRPGNRFIIEYWSSYYPSGVRQEGTYHFSSDHDQVCFRFPYDVSEPQRAPRSGWMSDCFRVSQTDEKTYSLKTSKGDYSFSYAVR